MIRGMYGMVDVTVRIYDAHHKSGCFNTQSGKILRQPDLSEQTMIRK